MALTGRRSWPPKALPRFGRQLSLGVRYYWEHQGGDHESRQTDFVFGKGCFFVTRLVAALVAVFAIAGIVGCAIFLTKSFNENNAVTYAQVTASLEEASYKNSAYTQGPDNQSQSADEPLPKPLQKYLSGDNRTIIDGWLDNLETQDRKQTFINELAQVVRQAEEGSVDPVDAINEYKRLKFQKLAEAKQQRYETFARQGAAGAALFALVLLLIVVALILVMLAVERHTRKSTEYLFSYGESRNT